MSDTAETLDAVERSLNRLRLEFEHLSDLAQRRSCPQTLQRGHASLARLLTALEQLDMELRLLRDELQDQPRCMLAGWRVTQRQILGTEALALQSDLDGLYQDVRRSHVDLAGALLEQD